MATAAGSTHPSPAWSTSTYTTHTALLVLLLVHTQQVSVSGETTATETTTATTATITSPGLKHEEEVIESVTSRIYAISTEEASGDTRTTPWPPDHEQDVSTPKPVTVDEREAELNKVDQDVTTADPSGYTAGYDVMKSVTFQVTLGVCMSLVGLLLVFLVLMMIYTKYRGWKDRMNIAPTVRTGGQVGTDRQELMT